MLCCVRSTTPCGYVVLPPLVLVISHVVVSTRSRILGFCVSEILGFPISRYLRFWDSPFPISPFRRSLHLRCCDEVASYYILRASSYILRYAHCTALPCSTCCCPMLCVGSNPWVTACAGAHATLKHCFAVVLYHCYIPTLCPLCLVQRYSATHYMLSITPLPNPILGSGVSCCISCWHLGIYGYHVSGYHVEDVTQLLHSGSVRIIPFHSVHYMYSSSTDV